jgi:hypothetical protein
MTESSTESRQTVEVWSFRRFDIRAGKFVCSIGKATASTIQGFGAETIPGSMEAVPHDALDLNGLYRPAIVNISPPTRRRLERLKAEYAGILEEENHERLAGWADRVQALSSIIDQLDNLLAPGDRLSRR